MPDRLLLRPSWTYTPEGVQRDFAVLVEGQRILDVGPLPSVSGAQVIELPRHLLLPGLINSHTHAGPGPIARGIAEDLPLPGGAAFYVALSKLWQIGYSEPFRQQLRTIVRWDVYSMLRTGTTTIVNQSSADVEGFFAAVEELGSRTYGCPILPLSVEHRLGYVKDGVVGRDDVAGDQSAELAVHRALFGRYDNTASGRIKMMLGPASAHTVPPAVLRQVRLMADEFHCPVSTHLCQAPSEVSETRAKYGMTPVGVLLEAGLLGPDLTCAHSTYVADEDLPVLRDSGAFVAHCPSRKAKEAVISPFVKFSDAGIPVVLGTDSFQCDLLEDAKVAAMLGKIAVGAVDKPPVEQVLQSATSLGADAVGRADLGRIQKNAMADLIAVDLSKPHNSPVLEPLRSALYYSSGSDVTLVMVDGRVLIRDGKPTAIDEGELSRQAQAACEAIWSEAERQGAIPR
jgi:5-methylthioadenosine/S-adenosylhomocysteine deaminase